jgi:predicted ATPase/signal transduction histidine kinase
MSPVGWRVEPGEVHRGHRYLVLRGLSHNDEPRILKIVRSGRDASRSAALLHHEHEVLASLAVPGVVRPYGLTELEGATALVLEDAGPNDLREWLQHRPLGVGAFLARAIQLADTVAALHGEKIIHRDINPTNIVVSADGDRLTLIDLGLATSVAGAGGTLPAGDLEGTLYTIAPEQTGRLNRPVDHRADLYSLGATFYEILTGRPPFSLPDPAELVHAHLARAPVPPAERNPEVPAILSDIVLKLLAKMPEQRYQSAEALAADLREVERRYRGRGQSSVSPHLAPSSTEAPGLIDAFELGRMDLEREFIVPGRLYGRTGELARLTAALERTAEGASELVLVAGGAGVGKSSLVGELVSTAAARGARCLSAKFEELRSNVPYAPILEAMRDLVRGLNRMPAAVVDTLRSRIRGALGPTASALSALVPELAELLGEAVVAGSTEAERLFPLAFQLLVQALATSEAPLVLFLDDLQWADAASLRLFRVLAGAEAHHLLLVGAFRPLTVGQNLPLVRTLQAVESSGIPVETIEVAPLDLAALTALVADTLRCPPERVQPLAAIVQQKTAGNPFFVVRFLRHLHQSGLLAFDADRGMWDWDERRTAQADVTENVVELMVAAIRGLPEETQRALQMAACVPGRIELDLLAALAATPVSNIARALWSALREGLLVSEVAPYPGADPAAEERATPSATYRFVHDRVQEAAYSLLSRDEQRRIHLAAGSKLLERDGEDRLFDAVDQLDRGAELVHDPTHRLSLAELNLRAARKARASTAFAQALAYAGRGLDLLPSEAWKEHHALWFALSREAAEGACLTGDFAGAHARIAVTLPRAATPLEKVDLDCLGIVASSMEQDHPGAVHRAREALRRFGLELPDARAAASVARAELPAVEAALRGRTTESLLAAPAMQDPDALACMRLLSKLPASAWRAVEQGTFSFAITRMVDLSLRYGMTSESGFAFARFGTILGEEHGDISSGYEVSALGIELSRRHGDARQECRAVFGFAIVTSHWTEPLCARTALLRRAAAMGLASGELEYAAGAREYEVESLFVMGAELDQVALAIKAALSFAHKVEYRNATQSLSLMRQVVRCLQGLTRGLDLDDDTFDTTQFLEEARRTQPALCCRYEIHALRLCYLFGDLAGARAMSAAAATHIEAVRASVELAEHNFYTSLTLAASLNGCGKEEERAELLAAIADNQRRLGGWAEGCPENFRHKHQLVAAEVARALGRSLDEVLDLYEQAIEGAHRESFLQDEALARELAGRCLYARGRRGTAGFHVLAAIQAYARWGATAKVHALEEEFCALLATPSAPPSVDAAGGAALDVISLLKAAETLSSEVVFERLIEKLMAVCLEVAGARRGALVLDEHGARVVRAVSAVSEPVVVERTALELDERLPRSLFDDVFASGEPVVLADAARRGRFTADPYLAGQGVKSALALPLRKQAGTVGVLYLENDLATHAFTGDRVRVLELLSSVMAIALENSLLFEKLTVEIGERVRAEEGLRFLTEASALLVESLDYKATLVKVARLAVPFLATWCTVDVLEPGGTLQRVAAAHCDPTKEPLLRELCDGYLPVPSSAIPAAVALRTGTSYLCSDVDDAVRVALGQGAHHADLVRDLGSQSLMAIPLVARDRHLGAITFFSAGRGRRYGPTDLALGEELAGRAACAIDNARLYQEAQEAIQLREDFVAVASHELNTPITSLQLAVQTITRGKASPSPEHVRRVLSTIERQGSRLATLVGEMLDISRIRAGKLDLHLEQIDLTQVVRECVERLEHQLALAKCPLSLRAEEPILGYWDRDRLAHVVTNLLTNAIKFGSGRPVHVSVEEELGSARVVVQDYGIGIEPARLSSIFDRFERGVSAEHYGGLGLGLYIVREIITALGGSVRAESRLGEGSLFTVELPSAGPSSIEADDSSESAPGGTRAGRTTTERAASATTAPGAV